MHEFFLSQYPPTPTAYPVLQTTPVVNVPLDAVGVWQSTDEVIGYWNLYGTYTQFVTYIVFALLIVATVFLVRRLFAQLTRRDET